ncbi:hypothetical protein L1987_11635 [Smallanthus sonchifolius]|uniref:Uncharacterized protein n=1 Tax=Smallanthus sonchifolius TaxID=185202 RepID=A0ACB9JBW2_9ASTR|nr:hypothetical protein L1987_11635 [Smallanthus sonchifolius]
MLSLLNLIIHCSYKVQETPMANEPILRSWSYNINKKQFVLVMSNRRKRLFKSVRGVLQCSQGVLHKMYDLGIPPSSDNDASYTLMRILGRRVASWLETPQSEEESSEDEDIDDGSNGYTSEPWTDFDNL